MNLSLTDQRNGRSRIAGWVGACSDRARVVVIGALVTIAAAGAFVATHFALNSDSQGLLSKNLPYLKRGAAFDRIFKSSGDQIVVVIDGKTPELAEAAAQTLATKLRGSPGLFKTVDRPDAAFFAREGLLFQSTADVQSQMNALVKAQPFLGPLAQDPTLRGLMGALGTALTGVSANQAKLDDLRVPITRLASALDDLRAGRPTWFSWSALISGKPSPPETLRQIILVTPVVDYRELESGAKATAALRRDAADLHLSPAQGVSVRLTGAIPLQDEQFGSLSQGVGYIAGLALAAIVLMLWLAVRSARLIGAIVATMLAGLIGAAAMGLAIFGQFNVISVAFIPLFVGLGIDFGIQFTVRFRSEHAPGVALRDALTSAGAGMGRSLILAATAIAVGFLAFAPTAYLGVSQLGVIAGLGMLLAVALNLTFLPALIRLLDPPPTAPRRDRTLERLDGYILSHRRPVLIIAALAAAASAAALPLLHFDFNPFHLQNPRSEAVATTLDLLHSPDQSPNSLEVAAPSLAAADALGRKISSLPEVSGVRTLSSYIPDDQSPKLSAIGDAEQLLGFSLDPLFTAPPPSDTETVASLRQTAAALTAAAAGKSGPSASGALRLAADLDWLSNSSPAVRARASEVIMSGLPTMLSETREALQAGPVSLATLPPEIVRNWLSPQGQARLSIVPKGDSNDNAVLQRFIRAVRGVAPGVTGDPVGIYEGGRTIAGAFIEAGVLSFIAITVLLFVVLRKPRDVAITMTPIVLTGLLTLASCVLIGRQLNYANIIALPLLFGIGVAFHIYFVMAWRGGATHLLQSSLTRAIFFSAMATATGFGSLWASHHPGTASMGELLMISLVWTLVSALLFQPALMGPPPADTRR